MAERQVSQHGSIRENVQEWEEEDIGEGDNVHQEQSQRSNGGVSVSRGESSNAIGQELKDLLQVMVRQQAAQNKKLDVLENRMETTSSKVDQVALKIKADDKKSFKKKGIEFQYKHNSGVIGNYEEIEMAVANSNYAAIPAIVDRGKAFIFKRQRTLRLADDKGWIFVEVYEADDIAIDSDDDKRRRKELKRL